MSGVQVVFPEQWVSELTRANSRYGAALSALVRDPNAKTKREHAAACREFAEVLASLPYSVEMPDGLDWALRSKAADAFRADAENSERWAQSTRDVGE